MIKAKSLQLGTGTDLLAAKTSLKASDGNDLILTDAGVVAVSHKTKRMVHLYPANIKGIELYYDTDLSQPPFNVPDWTVNKITNQDLVASIGPIPESNVARRPGRPAAVKQ